MIGTLLQDRYRLDSVIAQGGMGVVYRAHDTLLDRPVAVKLLSASGLGSEGRARLLQEAQSIARLNHPNIVAIYDAGQSNGMAFIVMELVEGKSLHDCEAQSLDEILTIARQVCAALQHAHSHDIIHRDLKPENVLITPGGVAKLMDFGLARSNASRLSITGTIVGTVFYLAPEQALGQEVDGRADLYALGIMLYELITGRLPFTGDDPLAVISQHIHAPVPPPRVYTPDLPPETEAALLKLLAKNPADRYATAHETALALSGGSHTATNTSIQKQAVPNNLPVQLSSFVGREREIDEVIALLSVSRLVTLIGPGGSGKTRLALQVSSLELEQFAHGVWLVELAPLSDPELVPQVAGSVLGLREQPGHRMIETLSDFLHSRQLLLVLDNCEHLIEACAQFSERLLRACPGLKILATSREAIGITGERAWYVPTLSLPDTGQLAGSLQSPSTLSTHSEPAGLSLVAVLAGYESVQLFVDRAVAVQPGFRMSDQNALVVAQICQRLDGIPLAIELAAARMKALSLDQIAARLDDRFNLLTVGSRTAMARQQTLRATIDWSHDLLSDEERRLFYRLSVFANGWLLEAAEAVCAGQGIEAPQVLDLLTHLVDKSLVLAEEKEKETRYRMLETIRQYAREKLQSSEEWEVVHRRHLEFFLRLAEQAEPHLRATEQVVWLQWLEEEHDNLRAALDWSLSHGEPSAGLRLAGSVMRFWYLHGYWREGREWLERTLTAGRGLEEHSALQARARALQGLGWLSDESGQEAGPYEESLAICRDIGDQWGIAFSLRGLGSLALNQDDLQLAEARLAESLSIYRQLEDPWGIALALFTQGWLAFKQDDPELAEVSWEESLSSFRVVGDRWGSAVSLGSLAYASRLKNDYGRATALSSESLKLFRELNDKAGIADSLARLGGVAFRRDEFKQAEAFFEESLSLNRELGYKINIAFAYSILGLVAGYQGDYQRAGTLLEESQIAWQETDYQWGPAWTLDGLGILAYSQGEVEQASEHWEHSLQIYREEKDQNGIAMALNGLGLVAIARGDYVQALAILEESLANARGKGEKRTIAMVLDSLGRLAMAQGDLQAAANHFKESLVLQREIGAKRGIAESLEGLAHIALELGQPERAAKLLGAAAAFRTAIGAPLPPVDRAGHDLRLAAIRADLNEAVFASAWEKGQILSEENWDQVLAYALQEI